jgi:hypothetical protein
MVTPFTWIGPPSLPVSSVVCLGLVDGVYNDQYYYITVKAPDNGAIKDMLDRSIGQLVAVVHLSKDVAYLSGALDKDVLLRAVLMFFNPVQICHAAYQRILMLETGSSRSRTSCWYCCSATSRSIVLLLLRPFDLPPSFSFSIDAAPPIKPREPNCNTPLS